MLKLISCKLKDKTKPALIINSNVCSNFKMKWMRVANKDRFVIYNNSGREV
jgi:hypothetical protein